MYLATDITMRRTWRAFGRWPEHTAWTRAASAGLATLMASATGACAQT
jgi:hypothetical protein